MIANTESSHLSFLKGLDEYKQGLNGSAPSWLTTLRSRALEQFSRTGIPSVKDEEWKYTNIAPLAKREFSFARKGELKEQDAFRQYCRTDEINLVLVNGIFQPQLSSVQNLPKGVTVLTIKQAVQSREAELRELLGKHETDAGTPFIALNTALMDDGVFVKIDDKTIFEQLIHIVHIASGESNIVSAPRTLIVVGKSAEATVMESHIGFDKTLVYFTNALTDMFLAENAVLHYTKSQGESPEAFHIGSTRVWQERNSNLDSFSLMVGALITRNNLNVVVDGQGCNSTLDGLYSLNGNQHVDNHTAVDHKQPNCVSNQLYKGILNGASRAVFNGKIFVRQIAQQTNSYQLNKNLLLGKDCRVDTKPQLEIFADDVKCTHGATIGQLNEDELFYLQTRSIPRRKAIVMLSHGFVDDLLNTIKSESVHRKLDLLLKPTFAALEE